MENLYDSLEEIFSEKGRLSGLPGYEFRPQQHAMASAIGNALQNKHHLIVEAPTGVGKSLAYLIPALLFATQEKRKAIVSTHTRNLQEQLLKKDIALVRTLLGRPFDAVSLKGRGNYLCTTRLANALRNQRRLFDDEEFDHLQRITEWSTETADGDIDTMPIVPLRRVWQQVCSEKGSCSPGLCKPPCFFQKARFRARSADLVIMNHALFFTLFAMQDSEEFFLFENDFVIFDEAHTLEQVAGAGTGKSLSRNQVLYAVNRLYNPKSKKGLLARPKLKKYQELCLEAEQATGVFFDEVEQVVRNLSGRSGALRIRAPYLVSDTVTPALRDLEAGVREVAESVKKQTDKEELAGAMRLIWEAGVLIREFLELKDHSATYWVELGGGKRNVVLHTAPTSVADSVGGRLFREDATVILTSGTLSVNQSLSYFQSRIGAARAETLLLDSPFDFRRQMQLVLARDIPAPDQAGYESALPDAVLRSVLRSGGKALVLFTNSSLMKRIAEEIRGRLEEEGIALLVQDGTTGRHQLLEAFKTDVRSVLFGLDSFWMGVDVPGEALEHVIITRLPFAVPDHPLIESRMELISKRGGSAFQEYTLPEAVLKFKQGVGRLIRSKSDKGLVTILDSRIITKPYGQMFLRSLPTCPVEIVHQDGSIVEVEKEEGW